MQAPLKEIVDLILSYSQEWSSSPEFYYGAVLPVVKNHFYIGYFTSLDPATESIMVPMSGLRISYFPAIGPAYSFRGYQPNGNFTFVGYLIYCPGYLPVVTPLTVSMQRSLTDPGIFQYLFTFNDDTLAYFSATRNRDDDIPYLIGYTRDQLISLGYRPL